MIPLKHTEARALPSRGPSLGVRLALLAICSILLMVLDHREHHLASVRKALSIAVYPIKFLVDLPFSIYDWASYGITERGELLRENRALRIEQLETAARLQRLAALEAENTRLRALMESAARVADRVLVAEIMSVDLDPYRHRIVINKGSRDGAYRGQPLLDANGIAGQITRADPFSSEAILISDPEHAVPVQVNRNGLRTIAVGTGDIGRLLLPFLPNNADVEAGDLLVTSGLGGTFPPGYPLGEIARVGRTPGRPFAEVVVIPAAALNRNREVLLVWFEREPEQTPEETVEETVEDVEEAPSTPPGDPDE